MHSDKPCPPWAEELIEYMRQVEVFMGTLPNKPNWKDENIKKMVSHLRGDEIPVFDEHKLELLFKKIITKLTDAGYSPEEICFFINERIKLENGPAYCSVEEIKERL